MSILSIQNLSKSFNVDKKIISVLDNVSLEIEKGDIFGVIGLSGEGKSTLVRCINLLEKPDSGIINYSKYDTNGNVLNTSDISLFKEDSKEKSYCRGINGSHDGNYYGIIEGLCGIDQRNNGLLFFIPKRILVIQMVWRIDKF